jgi:hypothetical protein
MVAYRTSAQATSPRLLMKVSNQFYIANAAECTVAQALVPEVIHSCRVQGMAREDHILTFDRAKPNLPSYLSCAHAGAAR